MIRFFEGLGGKPKEEPPTIISKEEADIISKRIEAKRVAAERGLSEKVSREAEERSRKRQISREFQDKRWEYDDLRSRAKEAGRGLELIARAKETAEKRGFASPEDMWRADLEAFGEYKTKAGEEMVADLEAGYGDYGGYILGEYIRPSEKKEGQKE